MKNYQVQAKQITQEGKPCGYITICHYDYGYKTELHFFTIPGALYTRFFDSKEKALSYMEKLYNEFNY